MRGKRILLSRPEGQEKELKKGLEKLGAEVVHLPMIEFELLDDCTELYSVFEKLETIDWLVFTSSNAVKFFFEAAANYQLKLYFYPNLKFATVGEKTKLTLEQLGYRTNFVPIKYTAEVLAENMDDVKDKNILIPRSNLASDEYLSVFETRGANVYPATIYKTKYVDYEGERMREYFNSKFDYLTFTSGSSFKAFHENLLRSGLELNGEKLISIGPSTAKVIQDLNYKVDEVADPHTTEGIIDCIKRIEKDA